MCRIGRGVVVPRGFPALCSRSVWLVFCGSLIWIWLGGHGRRLRMRREPTLTSADLEPVAVELGLDFGTKPQCCDAGGAGAANDARGDRKQFAAQAP